MAKPPPTIRRTTAGPTFADPSGTHRPGDRQRDQHRHEGERDPQLRTGQHHGQQGRDRSDGERDGRGERRMPRVGQRFRVDPQLDVDVRGERVLGGQLLGQPAGRLRTGSLRDVERRELVELLGRRGGQLGPLLVQQGALGVALAADGDVLPQGHRHGSRHQSGDSGGQDRRTGGSGPGNADDEGGRGHDAVVGAEHTCPKPVESLRQATIVGLSGVGGRRGRIVIVKHGCLRRLIDGRWPGGPRA